MPRVYVAASWRTPTQPAVVAALRAAGCEVYDFRNPAPGNHGFAWSEIDPDWPTWSPAEYRAGLAHPSAQHGFETDMAALDRAEAVVLVQPSGRSAALEFGWAVGRGKRAAVLLAPGQEPELMLKMAHYLTESLEDLVAWVMGAPAPGHPGAWLNCPCGACAAFRAALGEGT